MRLGELEWPRIAALVDGLASTGEPGLAVAVSIGSELVWTHCTGLASVELAVPITPDTRFRIASISKQMAAALVLMLADDGLLTLDDALHTHLPEMARFEPPVTLRHLLTMTSGLHEVSHLGWLSTGDQASARISQAEWRRLMATQRTPGFAAGSRFLYNNANYLLLQWVAEKATGQNLSALLQTRLFAPLGMADTLLPESATRWPARLASGYQKAADGGFDIPVGWRNAGAAGGVVSTLRDLARWASHLQSHPVLQRLAQPFEFANGQRSHYGLGLATGVHAGRPWFGHAGGLAGFSTDQIVFPAHGLAVTVLANRDDLKTMRLSRRMADHLIDGRSVLDAVAAAPPPPIPEALRQRLGLYASTAARRVVHIEAGPGLLTSNGLLLEESGSQAMRVLIGDEPLHLQWQGGDALVETHASGLATHLRRTTLTPPDAALAGHYALADIDARWQLLPVDGRLRMRMASPWRMADEFELHQAAPDLLVMAPAGGAPLCNSVLQVERNAAGAVTALVAHFDRSRGLRLARVNHGWTRAAASPPALTR
jgi:CubicO group peptidase (beta-lactamase class C family)